ncbi:hypothetical protein EV126DRAFT_241299 [Verticillium dahliae]|nr:hypothetical protein EV126DRAFT_241299 [Verticillium dahliae]
MTGRGVFGVGEGRCQCWVLTGKRIGEGREVACTTGAVTCCQQYTVVSPDEVPLRMSRADPRRLSVDRSPIREGNDNVVGGHVVRRWPVWLVVCLGLDACLFTGPWVAIRSRHWSGWPHGNSGVGGEAAPHWGGVCREAQSIWDGRVRDWRGTRDVSSEANDRRADCHCDRRLEAGRQGDGKCRSRRTTHNAQRTCGRLTAKGHRGHDGGGSDSLSMS